MSSQFNAKIGNAEKITATTEKSTNQPNFEGHSKKKFKEREKILI